MTRAHAHRVRQRQLTPFKTTNWPRGLTRVMIGGMALHQLLERGIRETLAESPHELRTLVAQRGMPEETIRHLEQALEALPGLLLALDGALYSDRAPKHARETFNAVVRYLLLEDDLIPTRPDGDLVLSLLDDVYLLHRAAQALREHVDQVDFRSVDGGVELLREVLPESVIRALDERIEEVTSSGH